MAKAGAPLAPPPTISDGMRESLDAGSDAMELVRVFERMRTLMAQAEEKLKKDRIQIKKERMDLEEERRSSVAEIAEERRLLAEEAADMKRQADSQRKALEAERRSLEVERKSHEDDGALEWRKLLEQGWSKAEEAQEIARSRHENADVEVTAKSAVPMPKRGVPLAGASESVPALRTKAPPVAKTKEPPVPHASVSSSAVPLAKPKPMGTPISTPVKAEETSSSRETPAEDEHLSDDLLIKHEDNDEADRLAREDDVESKQKPARPPPEPPTYWRHVKPPEKKAIAPIPAQKDEEVKEVVQEAKGNETEATETKLAEVPRKANPAYKANSARYKPPPTAQPSSAGNESLEAEIKDETHDAVRKASEVPAPSPSPAQGSAPSRMKAPPTRCPPQIPAQASSTQDSSQSPPQDSSTPVPKGKVKAAPTPAKAKVKAPPGY